MNKEYEKLIITHKQAHAKFLIAEPGDYPLSSALLNRIQELLGRGQAKPSNYRYSIDLYRDIERLLNENFNNNWSVFLNALGGSKEYQGHLTDWHSAMRSEVLTEDAKEECQIPPGSFQTTFQYPAYGGEGYHDSRQEDYLCSMLEAMGPAVVNLETCLQLVHNVHQMIHLQDSMSKKEG